MPRQAARRIPFVGSAGELIEDGVGGRHAMRFAKHAELLGLPGGDHQRWLPSDLA